ncbi:CDP-alcohol phosphatidyltransferase family protein [Sandaracinobacter neustonicus]|uniref:CDP-alcohol phosphatidyltransferase family protein n=1 Tax=Sandaracinobacter neustonicus TaxID=1715348 RepID=A0A501XKE2_9SPHN|nr:CDP-alcohol phosphatidyltransferase family protein [Sandaracinobacter neustonicus]TPE61040.1 CDP-alcohol phosphatidyltransferase family protein [Sandaracinobacter neustonicus]
MIGDDRRTPPRNRDDSQSLADSRLSRALLPGAIRLGLHPNLVTLAGLGFGLCAGAAFTRWADPRFATLGFGLLLCWLVMDGLDGQLARATGKSSDIGRLLDGLADYAAFVATYLALVLTHPRPLLATGLAAAAGVAHALQAQFYEGERATYVRRLRGQFEAVVRPETGGPFERFYNRAEALLANRTRPFDQALAATPPEQRQAMLQQWQPRAAETLRLMSPLSADGRVIVIWLALLIGEPICYWLWEIAGLSLLALAANARLRQAESTRTDVAVRD